VANVRIAEIFNCKPNRILFAATFSFR
jgi:hypothetical protein